MMILIYPKRWIFSRFKKRFENGCTRILVIASCLCSFIQVFEKSPFLEICWVYRSIKNNQVLVIDEFVRNVSLNLANDFTHFRPVLHLYTPSKVRAVWITCRSKEIRTSAKRIYCPWVLETNSFHAIIIEYKIVNFPVFPTK